MLQSASFVLLLGIICWDGGGGGGGRGCSVTGHNECAEVNKVPDIGEAT